MADFGVKKETLKHSLATHNVQTEKIFQIEVIMVPVLKLQPKWY